MLSEKVVLCATLALAVGLGAMAGCAGSVSPDYRRDGRVDPSDSSSPPSDTGGWLPDAFTPRPDSGPCPGGCDDQDACTNDSCVDGKCEHTPKVPLSCGDGKIDACEVCDNDPPPGGTSGKLCQGCVEIGHRLLMNGPGSISAPTNPYYSAQADSKNRLLTIRCLQPGWGVARIGGACESKEQMYLASGKLGDQEVVLTCANIGGVNNSTYEFYCARQP
jgi:hypothetical protein